MNFKVFLVLGILFVATGVQAQTASTEYKNQTVNGPSFQKNGRPFNKSGSHNDMSPKTKEGLDKAADAQCKAIHKCPDGEEAVLDGSPFGATGDSAKHDTVQDGWAKGQAKAYATRDIKCKCEKKSTEETKDPVKEESKEEE